MRWIGFGARRQPDDFSCGRDSAGARSSTDGILRHCVLPTRRGRRYASPIQAPIAPPLLRKHAPCFRPRRRSRICPRMTESAVILSEAKDPVRRTRCFQKMPSLRTELFSASRFRMTGKGCHPERERLAHSSESSLRVAPKGHPSAPFLLRKTVPSSRPWRQSQFCPLRGTRGPRM